MPIAKDASAARAIPRQRRHRQCQAYRHNADRRRGRSPLGGLDKVRRKKLNSTPRVSSSSGMTATTCWKNAGLTAPSQRVAYAPSCSDSGIAATSAASSGSRLRTVSRSKKSSKAVAAM